MRVALVCPYDLDLVGGVRTQVLGLAGALAASGHEVTVLGPGARGPDEWHAAASLVRVGASRELSANGSVAPLALSPASVAAFRRALIAARPEVIHVHEPFAPLLGPAALLSRRVPVLGTFHRAGAGAGYRAVGPLLRPLYRRLDGAVAVSGAARQTLWDVLGPIATDVDIVPNAVDVARFSSVADRRPGAVLFFGRLEPRKGASDLIAAVRRTPAVRTLRVVGSGPEAASLAAQAAGDGRICFLGRLGDDELAAELARAEVVVAPARGGESFGVVVLEAMAAGAPVLASALPGYREAAGDAASYFEPGDPDALARALAALLADAPRRAALASAGRQRAAERSFARQAEGYVARYQLLARPRSRDGGPAS